MKTYLFEIKMFSDFLCYSATFFHICTHVLDIWVWAEKSLGHQFCKFYAYEDIISK